MGDINWFRNMPRLYELGFVSAKEAKDTGTHWPQIIFRIEATDAREVEVQLQKYDHLKGAEKYLKEPVLFVLPETAANTTAFGYAACGVRVRAGSYVEYRINLRPPVSEVALTLTMVLTALAQVGTLQHGSTKPTNQQQLFTIQSICQHRVGGYGHALTGYVYPSLGSWLKNLGVKQEEPKGFSRELFKGAEFLPSIKTAMQETWRAIVPKNLKRYASDCYFGIMQDGRFSFSCFGDACDVSIYPDGAWARDADYAVEYGCHNLDSAYQQITMIAGLAALYELAAKEIG